MLCLYSLPEAPHERDPLYVAEGMTHEFTAYDVDAGTPIDFENNLFEQPHVSPLIPALTGFQFESPTNNKAQDRLQIIVMKIVGDKFDIDDDEAWAREFRDGERVDLEAAAVRIARDVARMLAAISSEIAA